MLFEGVDWRFEMLLGLSFGVASRMRERTMKRVNMVECFLSVPNSEAQYLWFDW